MPKQEEFDKLVEPIDETAACKCDCYVNEKVSRLFYIEAGAHKILSGIVAGNR